MDLVLTFCIIMTPKCKMLHEYIKFNYDKLMFHVCLYYTVLSFPCSLVNTCLEITDLLALVCVMFPSVYVTFLQVVLGQVWYLTVSIADLCLLIYLPVSLQCYTPTPGLKVIKLGSILRLKIQCSDWLLADTFYNLEALCHSPSGSVEEDYYSVFTIYMYGCDGNCGHVTRIIRPDFSSSISHPLKSYLN